MAVAFFSKEMNGENLCRIVEDLAIRQGKPVYVHLLWESQLHELTLPPTAEDDEIVVLASTKEEPTHWTLLLLTKDRSEAVYFDPLGQAPTVRLSRLLDGVVRNWHYSTAKLQHQQAATCGFWCCFAAHWFFVRNCSLEESLNLLTSTLHPGTDKTVVAWVLKLINRGD